MVRRTIHRWLAAWRLAARVARWLSNRPLTESRFGRRLIARRGNRKARKEKTERGNERENPFHGTPEVLFELSA
jgi:hypothetical protein